MEKNLLYLQKLGVEKINGDTKISHHSIDALLKKDFSKFNKPQFLGFLNILEKEYEVDLSDLRAEAKGFFLDNEEIAYRAEPIKESYAIDEEQKSYTLYIYVLLSIVMVVVIYLFSTSSQTPEPQSSFSQISSSSSASSLEVLEDSMKSIESVEETNSSEELNGTLIADANTTTLEENLTLNEEIVEEEEQPLPSITLLPKQKIWVGVIYLDDKKNRKHSYMSKKPIEINASKRAIIVTGFGVMDIKIGEELKEYRGRGKLYFYSEEGLIDEITRKEFKGYNGGRGW